MDYDSDEATGYSNESTPYYEYGGYEETPTISSSDDDSETEDIQQKFDDIAISHNSPPDPS